MKGKKRLAALLLSVLVLFSAVPSALAVNHSSELPASRQALVWDGEYSMTVSVPDTGDDTNYGLYIGVACGAAAVLAAAVLLGRKKTKK